MKKMSYTEELAFLQAVRSAVASDPELITKIMSACVQGTQERMSREAELRVDAEFALSIAHSMIPAAKLEKNPLHAQKIKRVLVNSGAFAGTPMAKQMEAELGSVTSDD